MATISNTFEPQGQPITYLQHYLKIEDSKSKELFLKTYESAEALRNDYERLSQSKEQYSLVFATVFPAYCDSITRFFQTLFIPHTSSILPTLESRIAKIAVSIFTILFDLTTLPVRLLTSIPYVIYQKCFNKETDHEIISLIRNNPKAADALAEGKVVIRQVTEDFPHIQAGSFRNKPSYHLQRGMVSGAYSDVYIKHTLYGKTNKNGEGSIGFDNTIMKASEFSHYQASLAT